MTDGNRVEWVGDEAAMRDLRKWADQLVPELNSAGGTFADRVGETVRSRVPRLSGQLAASVIGESDEEGALLGIGEGLDYAGWIEFGGTRGRPYVPEGRYLYPSALEAETEWVEFAADVASDTVRSFAWSTP